MGAAERYPTDGYLPPPPAASGFVPGAELGDTILDCIVERGVLGDLWLAHQPRLGREVLVKSFLPDLAEADIQPDKSDHRIQALARLDHPALTSLFRCGRHNQSTYLVYEQVKGMRLDRILKTIFGHHAAFAGAWDGATISSRTEVSRMIPKLLCVEGGWQSVVAQWGSDLAAGLHHAHSRGVVHRSLWSGNILVDRDARVRLFDFWYGDDLNPNVVSDLLPYLSPEEVNLKVGQQPVHDPRGDVFSLGVVLYFCLTGSIPYPVVRAPAQDVVLYDRNPPSICSQRSEVHRRLERIIFKALAPDPSERWQDAEEMGKALDAFSKKIRSRTHHKGGIIGGLLWRLGKVWRTGTIKNGPSLVRGRS